MTGRWNPPIFAGHTPLRHGVDDWRCTCGVPLSSWVYGKGRRGARDCMRFHRIDLWMAQQASVERERMYS